MYTAAEKSYEFVLLKLLLGASVFYRIKNLWTLFLSNSMALLNLGHMYFSGLLVKRLK